MLRVRWGGSATMEMQVRAWREQALKLVSRPVLLVGGAAGAGIAYRATVTGLLWPIPLLVGTYAVLATAALGQRLPFLLRVWALLSVLFAIGAAELVLSGTPGIGLCVVLAVLCLATLLVGPRGAAVLGGLACGMVIVLASLTALGHGPPISRTSMSWVEWTITGAVFAALGLVVVLSTDYLRRRLVEGMEETRQRSASLTSGQAGLQLEITERTMERELWAQYLEAITELTHSATAILDDPQELLERMVDLISERLAFHRTAVFLVDEDRTWLELRATSARSERDELGTGHRMPLREDGIVARVAIEGVAQMARETGEAVHRVGAAHFADTRSEVALPLRVRGETIGVLDVHSTEPGAFSDDDVGILQILADQIAVALTNARLSRQAQDSAAATRRAYGEMGLQTWRTILRSRGDLAVRHDPSRALAGKVPEGLAGDTDRESYVLDDTGEQRVVAVPIQVRGGHVVGAVRALKPDDSGPWSLEEENLLRALVDQLGVALDGAQLYQESQERAARERLIAGIAARMRESLDVDAVLATAVREIGELMGFAEVEVRMGVTDGDQP